MDVPVVSSALAGGQPTALPAAAVQDAPAQPQGLPAVGALSPVVAKLFSQDAILQPIAVSVTYRVEHGAIVTVFKDPTTGKEISQVPAEVLVQLAQFFDKHSGVTLDKSA